MKHRCTVLWIVMLLVACAVAAAPAPASALVAGGDGAWFWRSPQPQGSMLGGVSAQGHQLWAVGQGGTILHSSDDGASWQAQLSGSTADLNAVVFTDALHGWAVGGQEPGSLDESPTTQVILRTVDGGTTWAAQAAPGERPLRDLVFVDALHGWAVGDDAAVIRTTDGGETWKAVATGREGWLTCVHFIDAQNGWVGGPSGALLRTSDGGEHWRRVKLGRWARADVIAKPAFADARQGWAIMRDPDGWSGTGSGSRLVVTGDGGLHWRPFAAPSGLEFSAIAVDASGELWVAASDDAGLTTFLHSADGGSRWLRDYADAPTPQAITASAGGLCAVGYSTLTRADGGPWLPRSSWVFGPLQLQMFDDRDGVGLVDSYSGVSEFMRTRDGVNWERAAELSAGYPTGLSFGDADHGLVAGTTGRLLSPSMRLVVLATADGGATWRRGTVGSKWTMPVGLSMPDAQHGWVAGVDLTSRTLAGSRLLLATSDGGQTWRRQAQPPGFIGMGVCFSNALEGWLVGMRGRVMASAHTVDGGLHWELSTTRLGVVPETVSFLDSRHGWVTGTTIKDDRSAVLATTDGGATWTLQDAASSYRGYGLSGVAFLDALHGWLFAGDTTGLSTGGIWKTSDGGTTWTREASGIGSGVSGASVADGQVYVCGLDGFLSTLDRAGDSAPPVTYDDFDGRYHRTAVAVHLVAADIGGGAVAGTQYRVDDDPDWHDVGGAIDFAAPADHSGDGGHELYYRSADDSGNVESERAVLVPIDTLGPSTAAVGAARVAQGSMAALRYRVKEQTSPTVKVVIDVRAAGGRRVKTLHVSRAPVGRTTRALFPCRLRPGRYSFTVFARDLAGNVQTHAGRGSLVVTPRGSSRAARRASERAALRIGGAARAASPGVPARPRSRALAVFLKVVEERAAARRQAARGGL